MSLHGCGAADLRLCFSCTQKTDFLIMQLNIYGVGLTLPYLPIEFSCILILDNAISKILAEFRHQLCARYLQFFFVYLFCEVWNCTTAKLKKKNDCQTEFFDTQKVFFFLNLHKNLCCGFSLESSLRKIFFFKSS